MAFFDSYPRFFETSRTGAWANRLNKRHKAIFETIPTLFETKRVLDIASHDGRWSLAALQAGASDVVWIEARAHLIDNANENLRHYQCDSKRFRFIQDDIFHWLRNTDECFDLKSMNKWSMIKELSTPVAHGGKLFLHLIKKKKCFSFFF